MANASTPLVRANDAVLSLLLLFSLVATFLCATVFLGEPQDWSCRGSQAGLALGLALCLSCILSESRLWSLLVPPPTPPKLF